MVRECGHLNGYRPLSHMWHRLMFLQSVKNKINQIRNIKDRWIGAKHLMLIHPPLYLEHRDKNTVLSHLAAICTLQSFLARDVTKMGKCTSLRLNSLSFQSPWLILVFSEGVCINDFYIKCIHLRSLKLLLSPQSQTFCWGKCLSNYWFTYLEQPYHQDSMLIMSVALHTSHLTDKQGSDLWAEWFLHWEGARSKWQLLCGTTFFKLLLPL